MLRRCPVVWTVASMLLIDRRRRRLRNEMRSCITTRSRWMPRSTTLNAFHPSHNCKLLAGRRPPTMRRRRGASVTIQRTTLSAASHHHRLPVVALMLFMLKAASSFLLLSRGAQAFSTAMVSKAASAAPAVRRPPLRRRQVSGSIDQTLGLAAPKCMEIDPGFTRPQYQHPVNRANLVLHMAAATGGEGPRVYEEGQVGTMCGAESTRLEAPTDGAAPLAPCMAVFDGRTRRSSLTCTSRRRRRRGPGPW